MPLVRILVQATPIGAIDKKDSIVNTLYFNVPSLGPGTPNYDNLVNDFHTFWIAKAWAVGQTIDVRAYDMEDAEPRPVKARKVADVGSVTPSGPPQVALCLSYYADRNLPRMRGRIYVGPFAAPPRRPTDAVMNSVLGLADNLAGLGGVDVDWSLWSPTNGTHTRINHAWVDDSWDIIRSRKYAQTKRITWTGNG